MKNEQVLEELHQNTIDIIADALENEREIWNSYEEIPKATVLVGREDESRLTKPFKFKYEYNT